MKERKTKIERRPVVAFAVILVTCMMVSTVTAIPIMQSKPLNDAKDKLDRIINSKAYIRLKNFVEPRFDRLYNDSIKSMVLSTAENTALGLLGNSRGDPLYPNLVNFLNTLGKSLIILFGHNVFGYVLTYVTLGTLCAVISIVIGFFVAPLSVIAGWQAILQQVWQFIQSLQYSLGLIGEIVVAIAISPIILGLLAISIPISIVMTAVLCFTDTMSHIIIGNHPPFQPSSPNPLNGETGVNVNTDLSWTGGDPDGDPVTYDVYFGATSPPPKVASDVTSTSYDPGTMDHGTTYYWKIVAWDSSLLSNTSALWSFTTQPTGPVVAWGANDDGECNVPSPNTDFIAVAAGGYHSLGLKVDGSIIAWGSNNFGESNVPAPNTNFIAVAAGGLYSLGLKADGSIVAWGRNNHGQCDVPSPNTDFIAVAAGDIHSLGLKADGSIVAWGSNGYGQCNVPTPNTDFIAVAAGGLHSLGLKADGSIVGWGANDNGECNVPLPNTDFIAVAAGGSHSLGLKADGSVVAWGNNGWGQCSVPSPNTDFIAVAAGDIHSLGLKADGSIVAWGSNLWGQSDIPAPNTNFFAIADGAAHCLAIRKSN